MSRNQLAADVAAGLSASQISSKYAGCAPAGGPLFYEEMKACGYHPQREELDCAVEIKKGFGFNGPPCAANCVGGSHEYVLFCVDFGGGFVPVHTNGVHVHDEAHNFNPPWMFGVVVQSNPRLLALTNDGTTLQALAILSWNVPPPNCGYVPIWGNQLNFQIRLDP